MEEEKIERKKGHSIWLCVGVGVLSAFVTSWCIGSVFQRQTDELMEKIKSSGNVVIVDDKVNSNLNEERLTRKFEELKEIVNRERIESKKQAEKSLSLAKDVKKSDTIRSMYYVNAIALNPNDINTIKEYVGFMVNGVKDKSNDVRINTYQMLLAYIGNLSQSVQTQTIPELDKLSLKLNADLEKVFKEMDGENTASVVASQSSVDVISVAKNEWKKINSELKTRSLENNISIISDFVANYSSIGGQKDFVLIYGDAKKVLEQMIIDKQIVDLAEKCKNSIAYVKNESNEDHLLIELATIENDLNILISQKFGVSETYRKKILDVEKVFADFSKEIKTRINTPLLKNIDGVLETVEKDKNLTYEVRIAKLNNLIKSVQKNKLDSETKIKKVEEITKKISDMRSVQMKEYNKWALSCVEQVFLDIKNAIGLSNDEKKIMSALEYLGKIDTSYLSSSVHSAYQTVFQYGYSKLAVDEKIRTDGWMENYPKKELKDF